jgi:apolipoprotein D and lipocalin family protein
MVKRLARVISAVLPMLAATAAAQQLQPLDVVPQVDYRRYAGKWFEIARLPNRFEKDCISDVSAEYAVRPDGRITVTNRCTEQGGAINVATGIARREKGQPPSVLEVRFAPALLSWWSAVWGDYRIIALDDDYQHAVVGSDDRVYLWILARAPRLPDATYNRLVERAKQQGYAVDRLIRTPHTTP